ncbi:restriction endonuclease [Vibrio splendidus]|uniref:restriction endonuclease n=1 Tax=Vibrio splendidus TaxID=29497 RepID=UPI00352FC373
MTDIGVSASIDFGEIERESITPSELYEVIRDKSRAHVKIPIRHCHTMTDVAYSYLYASYILESLAKNFKVSSLRTSDSAFNSFNYDIDIWEFDPEKLHELLVEYLSILGVSDHIDENENFHYHEKFFEFELNIERYHFLFPDIVDNYFANWLNGGLQEMGNEDLDAADIKQEYKYGYWKSAQYLQSEHLVLVSTNCWIASNSISLQTVLDRANSPEKFSLLPANLILVNSQAMVVTENAVLQIAMGEVIQGIACIHEAFPEEHHNCFYPHRLDKMNGKFFAPPRNDYLFNSSQPYNFWQDNSNFELYASEFGEFVVFKTQEASLIVFNISKPPYSVSEKFVNSILNIASSFEDGVLLPPTVSLDWSSCDDEKFEQLCYDIIYSNSKFDSSTIRKMGNSRSRDGGRDIVVYTHEIHNIKPKKYIFQCKFTKTHKSINTSNIGSISDVVDQYGAEGYGVFCNTVIDSTLYDRLDGISNSRSIEIETWAVYEIERFVARRPHINQRYF